MEYDIDQLKRDLRKAKKYLDTSTMCGLRGANEVCKEINCDEIERCEFIEYLEAKYGGK